jgi:hypothetical protein
MSRYQEGEEYKGEPSWMDRESKLPDDIYAMSLSDIETRQPMSITRYLDDFISYDETVACSLLLQDECSQWQLVEDETVARSLLLHDERRVQEECQKLQVVEDERVAVSLLLQDECRQWQLVEDMAVAHSLA